MRGAPNEGNGVRFWPKADVRRAWTRTLHPNCPRPLVSSLHIERISGMYSRHIDFLPGYFAGQLI